MAAEVMTKLPACIDEVEVRRILGDAIQQPLNIVLLQEVSYDNTVTMHGQQLI